MWKLMVGQGAENDYWVHSAEYNIYIISSKAHGPLGKSMKGQHKSVKASDGEEACEMTSSGNGMAAVLRVIEQLQVPSQGLHKA